MTVSLCIVAYNEEKALPRLLNDIANQDFPAEKMEVLLIDSMSNDGTRAVMENFARENKHYKRVIVFDNTNKKLASGWNVAIRNAQEDILIRVDAHASIPRNFVSANVKCHEEGEYVSGGPRPNISEKDSLWQNTLLLAESSVFGSGIAGYRRYEKRKYVKSLFHGAYRREVFKRVGMFNEQLGRTEDNEMNYRIRKAGYRLCFDPHIRSYQLARNSLKGMMKQKYGNGLWVALTLKVCPRCLSVFHFVPFLFVVGIFVTGILAVLKKPFLAIAMWATYWIGAISMAILAVRDKKRCFQQLALPFLFFLLHVSYGVGSLVGIVRLPFWKYRRKEYIED